MKSDWHTQANALRVAGAMLEGGDLREALAIVERIGLEIRGAILLEQNRALGPSAPAARNPGRNE